MLCAVKTTALRNEQHGSTGVFAYVFVGNIPIEFTPESTRDWARDLYPIYCFLKLSSVVTLCLRIDGF